MQTQGDLLGNRWDVCRVQQTFLNSRMLDRGSGHTSVLSGRTTSSILMLYGVPSAVISVVNSLALPTWPRVATLSR